MKRYIPHILIACLVLALLGACSNKGELEDTSLANADLPVVEAVDIEEIEVSTENEPEELSESDTLVLYSEDELINAFLLSYNEIYPDAPISEEDFSIYTHHGRAHKDQVIFNENGVKEVVISSFTSGKIEVYVDNLSSDDEYKEAFIEYAKVYNQSLTNEILEDYWKQAVNSLVSYTEFDEFELHLQRYNEITDYFQISGKMED